MTRIQERQPWKIWYIYSRFKSPIFVLEMVSHTPGGEYDDKKLIYQRLGVLLLERYRQRFGELPPS
ncbi:MAG: hypothetical protein AAFN18_04515 [Cyanobacteria bacterium J06554_6]